MLAATAREAGAPLPVCFLHDVGWPYGRRDLYYAPERIPEEFRQPWAQKGLRLRPARGAHRSARARRVQPEDEQRARRRAGRATA